MDKSILTFNVKFSEIEPLGDKSTLSKARVRIFYKYENRNRSYITDDVAEQLISSLSYTPVKGIWSDENHDFTDHGHGSRDGKIYGIVPVEHNFAWENHKDEDGIMREYACADVYLFSTLYDTETAKLVDSSQSMELNADTIEGDFEPINGKEYFVFKKAEFLALTALGQPVEPCFEGASFYTQADQLLQEFEFLFCKIKNQTENKKTMAKEKTEFLLAYEDKLHKVNMAVWDANYEWVVMYTYDDNFIAYDYVNDKYIQVQYSLDSDEKVVLGDQVDVEMTWTPREQFELEQKEFNEFKEQAEKTADEYAQLRENYASVEQSKIELESKISEYEVQLQEKEEIINQFSNKEAELVKEQKFSVIEQYSTLLSDEQIKEYKESIDDFTVEELEKDLALEYVKSQNLFSFKPIPKPEPIMETGLVGILSKYKTEE